MLVTGQNRIHELPESFGKLCALRVCMLSKNHLQLLPSSFGDLCSLEDVRLDDNEVGCLFILQKELKPLWHSGLRPHHT